MDFPIRKCSGTFRARLYLSKLRFRQRRVLKESTELGTFSSTRFAQPLRFPSFALVSHRKDPWETSMKPINRQSFKNARATSQPEVFYILENVLWTPPPSDPLLVNGENFLIMRSSTLALLSFLGSTTRIINPVETYRPPHQLRPFSRRKQHGLLTNPNVQPSSTTPATSNAADSSTSVRAPAAAVSSPTDMTSATLHHTFRRSVNLKTQSP